MTQAFNVKCSSLLLSLLLAGCGTIPQKNSYTLNSAAQPDLTGFYACTKTNDNACEYTYAKKQAAAHAVTYGNLSNKNAKGDTAMSAGLLLGGLYTAGAVLFESDADGISSAVQDNLTGLGLVIAAATAYRGSIKADQRVEFFMKSRAASICVLRHGKEAEERNHENSQLTDDFINVQNLLVSLRAIQVTGYSDSKLTEMIGRVETIYNQGKLQLTAGKETPADMMLALDRINSETHKSLKGEPMTLAGVSQALYDAGTQSRTFSGDTSNDTAAQTGVIVDSIAAEVDFAETKAASDIADIEHKNAQAAADAARIALNNAVTTADAMAAAIADPNVDKTAMMFGAMTISDANTAVADAISAANTAEANAAAKAKAAAAAKPTLQQKDANDLLKKMNDGLKSLASVQTLIEDVQTQRLLVEGCPALLVDTSLPDPETDK